jgi:hypothetical protein
VSIEYAGNTEGGSVQPEETNENVSGRMGEQRAVKLSLSVSCQRDNDML